MQRLLNDLKDFCYKHYKLLLTIILFTCAHSCFHRGSKVNQENLCEILSGRGRKEGVACKDRPRETRGRFRRRDAE
jgi:hypothetical protein